MCFVAQKIKTLTNDILKCQRGTIRRGKNHEMMRANFKGHKKSERAEENFLL